MANGPESFTGAIGEINYGLSAGEVWESVSSYNNLKKEFEASQDTLDPDIAKQVSDDIDGIRFTIEAKLDDPEVLDSLLSKVTETMDLAESALNAKEYPQAEDLLGACRNIILTLNSINREKFGVKSDLRKRYDKLISRHRLEKTNHEEEQNEDKGADNNDPEQLFQKLEKQIHTLEKESEGIELTLALLNDYLNDYFSKGAEDLTEILEFSGSPVNNSVEERLEKLRKRLGQIGLRIVESHIININDLIGSGKLEEAEDARKTLQSDFSSNRTVIPFEQRKQVSEELSALWEKLQRLTPTNKDKKSETSTPTNSNEISLNQVKTNPPDNLRSYIQKISEIKTSFASTLSLDKLIEDLNTLSSWINRINGQYIDSTTGKYRNERDYYEIRDYIENLPSSVITELVNRLLDQASRTDSILREIELEKGIPFLEDDPDMNHKIHESQNKLNDLKQQFENKYSVLSLSFPDIKAWYDKNLQSIQTRLSELSNKIDENKNNAETFRQKDRELTKLSIERFLTRRGVPLKDEKPEYKDINIYLATLHDYIIKIAITTLWNQLLDKSGGSDPRTVSYLIEPMKGPSKSVSLLENQLIYLKEEDQGVFSLESLLDQLQFYFDKPEDSTKAGEFAQRLKDLFNEVSIWHNRAYTRRHNETMTGPEGALKALHEIAHNSGLAPSLEKMLHVPNEALESEKRFAEAVEYSMAVWSVISLKQHERQKLWVHIDPRIKSKYFEIQKSKDSRGNLVDTNPPQYVLKSDFDVFPVNNSTEDLKKHFVESIIADLKALGISESQAQLAYHIGESYRIGAGLEAFWDVKYVSPTRKTNVPNAKVIAKEGEPKGANIGLYVESAWSNPVRPDFNIVYKDYLVHGYIPYNRALQLSHNYQVGGRKFEINEFGDGRASLAEILSVKGAIKTVDWHSVSTSPDEIIEGAATQAINFLWPGASISKSVKPENSFFLDVRNVPLTTNVLIDREDETVPLSYEFGAHGAAVKGLSRLMSKISLRPSIETTEMYGFRSDSSPISGDRNQHLRNLYKNLRDYWINPFGIDQKRFPYDKMRMMRFMFSRDDMPDGYVNEKIRTSIENTKNFRGTISETDKKVSEWSNWLVGYLTYDLLMRSVYYLLKPDFRNVDEIKNERGDIDEDKVASVYNTVDSTNFENLLTTTIGGARLLNAPQLMYVINQSMLLQQQFPEETKKMASAGYKLFGNYSNDTNNSYLFTHYDLLKLAQEFGMGEGYKYKVSKDSNGRPFMQVVREGSKPTVQWLIDRITLLQYLFKRDSLKLSSK